MCGIVGYYGQGNKEILTKMADSIAYRGPDDNGIFADNQAGLGHRRLSIIDLSAAGRQPISNEDDSVFIVFNGEIYNFVELKSYLGKHNFKSDSDTEVILHLFEEERERAFGKLNGMFAIAIYDKKRKKIYLGRDRMGQKPLYYALINNTLIFGSEIKALLKHKLIKKELDLFSLNKYLQYEYIPTPNTIFKGIKKLEPGHFIIYDGIKLEKNCYWNISFSRKSDDKKEKEVIKELDAKFDKAVGDRLVSDVPLGIFLSGGIDSSTIAYYAQKKSSSKIKTFSIGFREKSFNESGFARTVSAYLGTEHHEEIVTAEDMLAVIDEIFELLDEPMADASVIPTYILSRFTKKHVTVALGGDGGDELFCGYDTFLAHKGAELYEKIPLAVRKNFIEAFIKRLPTSFNNISFDFAAKSFVKGFYGEKRYRDFRWLGSFNHNERSKLFNQEVWAELKNRNEYEEVDNYIKNIDSHNFYDQLIYLYLRMYMMDDILVKADRASMYNSLEIRSPLIDYHVVDYVNSLPTALKMKGFKTKYILRKLMAGKLPDSIINRKKKGFGIPLADWISGPLKPMVKELLSEKNIKKQGLFNINFINKLLSDHFSRKQDNRKPIWTLLVFQLWQKKWLNNNE